VDLESNFEFEGKFNQNYFGLTKTFIFVGAIFCIKSTSAGEKPKNNEEHPTGAEWRHCAQVLASYNPLWP